MIQEDQDRLEAALRQIPPATVPPDLLARLRATRPQPNFAPRIAPRRASPWTQLQLFWRGLLYGTPAAATLLLIWFAWHSSPAPTVAAADSSTGIKASAVQVGHSLLASFDTVAQLPGGTPVRFHCREWQDEITIHDRAHGVEVTQCSPRVEIVPVRFEFY